MARGSGRTFTSGLSAFADPISRLRAVRAGSRAKAVPTATLVITGDGVVTGSNADDTLYGGVGDDTLDGRNGQDTLFGGDGNDTLDGGNGSDTLVGGPGADILDGGQQNNDTDFASYANATAGVTVDLGRNDTHDFAFGTGDAAGDVFISIEGLIGSAFGDLITETGGIRDTIYGGAGNDQIDANPSLGNGTGVDNSGAISETLYGGAGFDHANYSTTNIGITLALDGTAGVGGFAAGDRLFEIERLTGSQANDVLGGSANADTLDGSSGNDTLQGGAGADSLDGGSGTDFASYANAASGVTANLANAGAGTGDALGDTFIRVEGLIGSAFNDVLIGDGAVNTLIGNGGNDTLQGGAGADRLEGGLGTDFADYSGSAAVTVNLATGVGTGGEAAGDIFIGIEGLIGSAVNDVLIGDGTANTLVGNGGDDTLRGGAGADRLEGGTGVDFADYSGSAAVTVNLATGSGTGGEAAGDTFIGVEGLIGSAFNDLLIGDGDANTLIGNGGNDTLQGGVGSDRLDGGAGTDFADYSNTAGVTVDLATGEGPVEIVGDIAFLDTLASIEGLIGSNTGDDVLIGDGGANTLIGNGGNDTLGGGAGADRLEGGVGTDFASYANAGAGVTANLANAGAGTNDAAGDTYSGIEGLIGSAFNDVLIGDGAVNTLFGGIGNDTLDGGAMDDVLFGDAGDDRLIDTIGSDSIFGGIGNDTVQFSSASFQLAGDAGTDTLLGTAGDDSIDLGLARFSAAGGGSTVTANTNGGGFEVFDLGAGDDRLFYSTASTNNLSSTVFGGAGNDLIAMLDGGTNQGSSQTLFGGDGGDTIYAGWFGFGGNATVFGGAGDDFIYSGAGTAGPGGFDDTLYGGAGDDTYYWSPNNGGFGTDVIFDSESGPRGNGLVIFGGNTAPFSGFPDTGSPDNLATGQVVFSALGGGLFKIENKDDPTDSITFRGGDISIINLQSRPGGLGTGENFIYTWDAVNGVFVDQNG